MSEVTIFKCIGSEVESIPEEVLAELGSSYEELNQSADKIVLLAKTLKERKKNSLCRVPFCHTVEAEAFGSQVTFDHKFGNRIKGYALDSLSELASLRFDPATGRIAQVLEAIRLLKAQGESVVLEITGPFTIGTSVLDSQKFFRAVRKEPALIQELLGVMEDALVEFIRLGVAAGADVISVTDPAGTLDIVGEKMYAQISGRSMLNILKRVEDDLGSSLIHLCGKTSTSLEKIGMAKAEWVTLEGEDYFGKLQKLKAQRPQVRFIGHWCMKTRAKRPEVVVLELAANPVN